LSQKIIADNNYTITEIHRAAMDDLNRDLAADSTSPIRFPRWHLEYEDWASARNWRARGMRDGRALAD
jgi:hypothetical protein